MQFRKIKSCCVVLLLFSTQSLISQNCACTNTFTILKNKVEQNYAGFTDKVTQSNKAKYLHFVNNLQKKVSQVKKIENCYPILNDYITFFKDKHLQIALPALNMQDTIQSSALTASDIYEYFKKSSLTETGIEGIWESDAYTLAIIKKTNYPTKYDAIVIDSKNEEWKMGMVKMHLQKVKPNYFSIKYVIDKTENFETKAFFDKNILDILSIGVYTKKYPTPQNAISKEKYQSIFPDANIKFTFPNDSTALLFLGSFNNQYEAVVDSLLLHHKTDLEKRSYWIIDISHNGGGGTGTYKSLLPYLYTNTIKRSGSYYWLSPDNVNNFEKLIINNPGLPPTVTSFFSTLISTGRAKPNSWYFEEKGNINFDSIKTNPKKIGVLVSKKTASSAEIFIMDAQQSKKVVIFGSQTAGVVDYGDGTTFIIGCDSIQVSIPTRKSAYLKYKKYDNIGIQPAIHIPEEELFPYPIILKKLSTSKLN